MDRENAKKYVAVVLGMLPYFAAAQVIIGMLRGVFMEQRIRLPILPQR